MPDAAYYRAWRAAHPEYRKRETKRSATRKVTVGRGDRSAEYKKRAAKLAQSREPIPALHQGHELFDQARTFVTTSIDKRDYVYDPLRDELISVAVLALLSGDDPRAAVRAEVSREMTWRRIHLPLITDERSDSRLDAA